MSKNTQKWLIYSLHPKHTSEWRPCFWDVADFGGLGMGLRLLKPNKAPSPIFFIQVNLAFNKSTWSKSTTRCRAEIIRDIRVMHIKPATDFYLKIDENSEANR
jgi:hypothetical protein